MIDVVVIEHDRAEAERCKYQRGSAGVWARRWLLLYQHHREELERIDEALTDIAEQTDG